ncbi:MAG: flagellar motor protein [Bryobacteraceae bacterium]|jgi:chemotaxis protein MotA
MAEQAEKPKKAGKADKAKPAAPRTVGTKIDLATVGGLVLSIGGIITGMTLEGGSIKEILQPTAALIVFGGTIGAVMITTPLAVLVRALRAVVSVFMEKQQAPNAVIEEIIGYATKARKNGIVSLEQDAATAPDKFLRKALNLAVDGTDLQEIHKMMELEMAVEERRAEMEAKVFEAAGGYSPTIGIIGAVLGLIQVMKNLANIDEVGRGIAVAFVATIYGVASANILFLPVGTKIKARTQAAMQIKELMLEGVAGIVEGLNPKLIRTKLEAYLEPVQAKPAKPAKEKAGAAAAAPPAATPAAAGAAPAGPQ